MLLSRLCSAIGISLPDGILDEDISSIETDSRRVCAGGMFVCIKGTCVDGHLYAEEAVRRGAHVLLFEKESAVTRPEGILVLECESTRRAVAHLYNAFYGFPTTKLKFIGVTGTNGKTSVTHLICRILEGAMHPCGLIGTVGCESRGRHLDSRGHDPLSNMTTPDPDVLYRLLAEMVEDGVEYVVMEVTSHALALEKLAPIRFQSAVFTNLTPEHLDFHGTMECYADAKARLFQMSECAVINADSPYAARMIAHVGGDLVTSSVEGGRATYHAIDIESGGKDGVRYTLSSANRRLRLRCPIPGRFTVINSMQAAICALELGIPSAAVKEALSSAVGVKGRMERVRLGPVSDITVLIDYAHTPDALENLLRTARDLQEGKGRLVLLFGCGGDRDRSKRATMGMIASRLADRVYLTSDNSRGEDPMEIIKEIRQGFGSQTNYKIIPDRERAIRTAIAEAEEGDLLLLSGKGHEKYEIGRNGRCPFCEEQIVKDAFLIRKNRKWREDHAQTQGDIE